jgi:hypothetical protein
MMGPVVCKVTNTNDFDIADMYDGVPYVFKARGKDPVPLDPMAALHIFGWTADGTREAWKIHTQKRWGWNTIDLVKSGKADLFFERMKFETVRYRLVEVVDNGEDKPVDAIETKGGAHMQPVAPGAA